MDDPDQIFKFKVEIRDKLDNFQEEDLIKQVWPSMYGFLTRRRGLNEGVMDLENGAVTIRWSYTNCDKDDWWDEHCEKCGLPVSREATP